MPNLQVPGSVQQTARSTQVTSFLRSASAQSHRFEKSTQKRVTLINVQTHDMENMENSKERLQKQHQGVRKSMFSAIKSRATPRRQPSKPVETAELFKQGMGTPAPEYMTVGKH